MPIHLIKAIALSQLVLLAAIFGFFFAFTSTVMWGLDHVGGITAINAMNGINSVVRNALFAPAFFGPLIVGLLATFCLWRKQLFASALWFGFAYIIYLFGGFLPTAFVSVPLNQGLLILDVPTDPQEAIDVWTAYSESWKFWNDIRTLASGAAFTTAAIGFHKLGRETAL